MATVNDLVLIYLEDSPVSFARIESILPDAKKDWYHIRLLMLQVPLQVVTWILKTDYINGHEFFMNGKKMKLEKVKSPAEEATPLDSSDDTGSGRRKEAGDQTEKPGRIISFSDFRKKT